MIGFSGIIRTQICVDVDVTYGYSAGLLEWTQVRPVDPAFIRGFDQGRIPLEERQAIDAAVKHAIAKVLKEKAEVGL